jgi:hypothetical protein
MMMMMMMMIFEAFLRDGDVPWDVGETHFVQFSEHPTALGGSI